jgi:PAS domain S-box-containing protein
MNTATAPTLAAIIIQIGLGLIVFQANPRRRSNQCFLLLSVIIGAWLTALYVAFGTRNPETAASYIRHASAAGAFILVAFNLLRLSIVEANGWREILLRSWVWLAAAVVVAGLSQTTFFLEATRFSQADGSPSRTPIPVYGKGAFLYAAYFIAAGLATIITYTRDTKRATGTQRSELGFILVGAVVTLTTLLLAFVLGLFIDRSRLVWFAPFRIALFSLIIAYGIATRKIMEVGMFLRRAMSYFVLAGYLVALYLLAWWLVESVFEPLLHEQARTFAHICAALVVAFAMAPARGVSQRLADRLFVNTGRLDFRSTMSEAAAILKSVTTLPDLLERFAQTVAHAVGSDQVLILLRARHRYEQRYPVSNEESARLDLSDEEEIIKYLQARPEPLVLEELDRVWLTPELMSIRDQMQSLGLAVAMPIYAREHLAGVMLLGRRHSGRIYGTDEQSALQVLCGQLAVAIENAELFTKVQNAKIYNETLLENLTTGVIAASGDGRITVFNREAEQITGLSADSVLDQPLDRLPSDLRDTLRVTLATGERQENAELQLGTGEREMIARVSSSVFHDGDGQRLGALMVLTDVTAVKRLEAQIRRSDRLASLGTLSAGMAHEIKNPLVSIKTFTQLLPERYQDSEFRETFSNLIGHEIDRIDSLVNQLLRFARPAKPLLKPMHVHEVLEKSLMLVGHRLYQKEIKLNRSWGAEVDTIRADADQLEQVFLNFFLNAMDAMEHGGELTVETHIRTADNWVGNIGTMNIDDTHEVLRITIRDNGEGISEEHVGHVFDPFFTTKDYGTGLGLSVVHGIIQEHGGQIEVESELTRGTAFHISLPLVRFDESEVAAA